MANLRTVLDHRFPSDLDLVSAVKLIHSTRTASTGSPQTTIPHEAMMANGLLVAAARWLRHAAQVRQSTPHPTPVDKAEGMTDCLYGRRTNLCLHMAFFLTIETAHAMWESRFQPCSCIGASRTCLPDRYLAATACCPDSPVCKYQGNLPITGILTRLPLIAGNGNCKPAPSHIPSSSDANHHDRGFWQEQPLAAAKVRRRYPLSRLENLGDECQMNSL